MKVKEKLETIRKQESEMNEKEEKKETAKKVNHTQKICCFNRYCNDFLYLFTVAWCWDSSFHIRLNGVEF